MKKGLFYIFLAFIGWNSYLAIYIWNFSKIYNPQKSDVVIVLGASIYGNKPSPVFLERIKHSIYLYKKGYAKKIIFTGGFGINSNYAESQIAMKIAKNNGVKDNAILIETVSKTTQQNLYEAKKIMKKYNFKTALIVSDPLHQKRALTMAKDLDISAYSTPTLTSKYKTFEKKIKFLFREIIFYNVYLLTGY